MAASCAMMAGMEHGNISWDQQRANMVKNQLVDRAIADERVLAAMGRVPRHEFVPDHLIARAYHDTPLPIGFEQTISQPYIVAAMSALAAIEPDARVLEIGTGCGYQTAVLADLAAEVYSIEIVAPLADQARQTLVRLGYQNIHLRTGDGYLGWPEAAPFDAILVTAAPPSIPPPLMEQLVDGGRLSIPGGGWVQELWRLVRTPSGVQRSMLFPVRFVPMTGRAQAQPEQQAQAPQKSQDKE